MKGHYTVFKREQDGTQGDMIADYTELDIDLYWGKLSKIRISGVSRTGDAPVSEGDGVDIYRNGVYFLGGIIDEMKTECRNPVSGVKQWGASGNDDTVLLERRQILADPVDLTFASDEYDRSEDYAHNRIIHYINNSAWRGTTRERWLAEDMTLPSERPVGTEGVSAYRSVQLKKSLDAIGKSDELYPVVTRNPKTGALTVTIPEARDMTEEIIISPDFGSVTKWSRSDKMPSFNAVWVVSAEYSRGRLYVYAEDLESIAAYGRIEAIVTKSDAKVWEEDENSSEEDEGTAHLTEEDVIAILEEEAKTQLKDHGVKRTWTIDVAETQELAFMDVWQVGDRITCVIDGEKFETQITHAKISYKEGVEKVEPTVGSMERGLFGQLFDLIDGLDDRITRKENE